MSQPPPIPEPPPMGDEASDVWRLFQHVVARLRELEGIAERLSATSADPVAAVDYWEWKARG